MANTCIEPHTFPEAYEDVYTCLLDGYKKSIIKTEEIGREDINTHGIYIKFDCKEIILPEPNQRLKHNGKNSYMAKKSW